MAKGPANVDIKRTPFRFGQARANPAQWCEALSSGRQTSKINTSTQIRSTETLTAHNVCKNRALGADKIRTPPYFYQRILQYMQFQPWISKYMVLASSLGQHELRRPPLVGAGRRCEALSTSSLVLFLLPSMEFPLFVVTVSAFSYGVPPPFLFTVSASSRGDHPFSSSPFLPSPVALPPFLCHRFGPLLLRPSLLCHRLPMRSCWTFHKPQASKTPTRTSRARSKFLISIFTLKISTVAADISQNKGDVPCSELRE